MEPEHKKQKKTTMEDGIDIDEVIDNFFNSIEPAKLTEEEKERFLATVQKAAMERVLSE